MSTSTIDIGADGIVRSKLPPLEIPDITLGQYLFDKLKQNPEHVLFIEGETGREWTSHKFLLEVLKVVPAIRAAGIQEGQVVGLYAPNSIQHAAIQIASYLLGAVYAGCYWFQTEHEFRQILSSCPFDIVFCCTANLEVTNKIASDLKNIKKVINIDDDSYHEFLKAGESIENLTVPAALNKSPKDAIASILFSSGSTGPPKAAIRTNRNLLAHCIMSDNYSHSFGRPGERFVLPMAYCHMSGMYALLSVISDGLTAITITDLDRIFHLTPQYKPNLMPMVPSGLVTLVKNNLQDKFDLSSIKHIVTAGATLPKYIIRPAMEALKLENLRQFYGMSESGFVTSQPLDVVCPESIGQLLPGTEVKVVDPESGKILGPDQVGELLVRGPEVMPGYLNNPRATKDNITEDGFLKTGDAIKFDQNGQFFIVDRFKEVMKVEGKQVAPAELEELLLTHPAVQEAVVVAKDDPVKGQIPKAFITLKKGYEQNDVLSQEILKHVHERIIFWKHIYGGIEFLDAIPKIGVGKNNRVLLKKRANAI